MSTRRAVKIRIADPQKDIAKINEAFNRLYELDTQVQTLIKNNKLK